MNKIFLIGRLTKEPELRYTTNNKAIAIFGLAVNRNYSNQDGTKETDFFNIVVWGKAGENCSKYLDKGNQVAIIGELHNRKYQDKNGEQKQVSEIVAESVQFLENKKTETNRDADALDSNRYVVEKQVDPFEDFANEIKEEELPF